MTAKEAFNDITHELRQRHMDMYADCDKESVSLVIDEMNKRETIVVQALTELEALKRYPTSEEVCEAIQEECKIEKVVYKCHTFYDEEDGETLVSQFNCDGNNSIDFHDFIFSVDTLIKICRFYEGLEK